MIVDNKRSLWWWLKRGGYYPACQPQGDVTLLSSIFDLQFIVVEACIDRSPCDSQAYVHDAIPLPGVFQQLRRQTQTHRLAVFTGTALMSLYIFCIRIQRAYCIWRQFFNSSRLNLVECNFILNSRNDLFTYTYKTHISFFSHVKSDSTQLNYYYMLNTRISSSKSEVYIQDHDASQ